ncbi:c-type cytochrome (plasmid) [Martelella lutilitoris]|jgi:cytochrome c553|uniref:C-type cytochrome n=1 Tax=Martelella lutilitoris TaxID=2583532 RepID=A0A7T7HPP4_9HYPH|nr:MULTISPECIES: c-type cytochrome [Martelella]AMM87358.1 cytochrome C [Martelella sp. AD-3]QQM33075.1 c-type cytochrome [Martelella lutilitoris]QRX65224.1 c-type cytochrome [Dysgonomonadaceae bacterium zrk40]
MHLNVVITWKRISGLAVLGLTGALLVGWIGLVSIAASAGHWSVTQWFLGWTMENAVRTQSMLISKPEEIDLGDPMLVRRAAGHYATGCASCHGAPGVPQSPVVEEMVPSPPRLEEKVAEWSDEELFWIVRNGIKYSGMPAWPAQDRKDEVWAQVAFLRALPEMSRAEYANLALGGGLADDDLEAGGETMPALAGIIDNALSDCARCHGRDGLGRGEDEARHAFPVIAGQPAPYLYATLLAFARGDRQSGFMEPPATRYETEVLAELAHYFAAQPAPPGSDDEAVAARGPAGSDTSDDAPASAPPAVATDAVEALVPAAETQQDEAGVLEGEGDAGGSAVPMAAAAGPPASRDELLELGRGIALEGIASRKLPACQSCHGAAGRSRNPYYPYLSGLPEWYLSEHLHLWKEGTRGGTQYTHVMAEIAENMTQEQIQAVSAWYATQASEGR